MQRDLKLREQLQLSQQVQSCREQVSLPASCGAVLETFHPGWGVGGSLRWECNRHSSVQHISGGLTRSVQCSQSNGVQEMSFPGFLSPRYLKYRRTGKLRAAAVWSVTVAFTWPRVYPIYSLWHTLTSERGSEQEKLSPVRVFFFLTLAQWLKKFHALIDVSTLKYWFGLLKMVK